MHEPWRLRLSYAYSYSDTDHYCVGEKRDHDIEEAPEPDARSATAVTICPGTGAR